MWKIDIIYAYPLMAAIIGLLVILFTYWIWILQSKTKQSGELIITILMRIEQLAGRLKLHQLISDVEFYEMQTEDDSRFNMKLPMLRIKQMQMDDKNNITTIDTKEFIYWEGIQYLLECATLNNEIHHTINLVNYNKAKSDFELWKSKPAVE